MPGFKRPDTSVPYRIHSDLYRSAELEQGQNFQGHRTASQPERFVFTVISLPPTRKLGGDQEILLLKGESEAMDECKSMTGFFESLLEFARRMSCGQMAQTALVSGAASPEKCAKYLPTTKRRHSSGRVNLIHPNSRLISCSVLAARNSVTACTHKFASL